MKSLMKIRITNHRFLLAYCFALLACMHPSNGFSTLSTRSCSKLHSPFKILTTRTGYASTCTVLANTPSPNLNNNNDSNDDTDNNNLKEDDVSKVEEEEAPSNPLERLNAMLDTPILDANNRSNQGPIAEALKDFVRDDPQLAQITFSGVVVVLFLIMFRIYNAIKYGGF